jgi:ADP-ribosylglycohydrolase
VRNAISLGGDSDTMGCIAGGIAQAYYKKIPAQIVLEVKTRLSEDFLKTIEKFEKIAGIDY